MLWRRNLLAPLMAAMLSMGTMGVALAQDSGSDFVPVPQNPDTQLNLHETWAQDSGSDFVPVPQSPDTQLNLRETWAQDSGSDYVPVPNPDTQTTLRETWA